MIETTGASTGLRSPESELPIKPLSIPATVLLFAVPSAVFSFSYLALLPFLVRRGFSLFAVFNLAFVPPLALLLIAALAGLKLERRPVTWRAIRNRFRLGRMSFRAWLWTAGILLLVLAGSAGLNYLFPTSPTSFRLFTWPQEFTHFMQALHSVGKDFLGIPLPGHWWVFLYFVFWPLALNIFGEEFWWRGYILPRQELSQGRWAWLINGFLWDLFHIFYHQTVWSFLALFPATLGIAFVCQKVRSTWPGIVIHAIANIEVPIAVLLGVLNSK